MERCYGCERLEAYIAQAVKDKDETGRRVRARLLNDHQRGNCINKEWYTGHVRVMAGTEDKNGRPALESIRLLYAGPWPGGKSAYVVERERQ